MYQRIWKEAKMKYLVFAILFAALLASTTACATIDTNTAIETQASCNLEGDLYNRIVRPTIRVYAMFVDDKGEIAGYSCGTGVIVRRIGDNYYATTCAHVIDTTVAVEKGWKVAYMIEHADIGVVPAGVVYQTLPHRDMAIIGFTSKANLPLAFLATKSPRLLSKVYACGWRPVRTHPHVTMGLICSFTDNGPGMPAAWEHSAPVWYGYSGGGLFNEAGELIGINAQVSVDYRKGQVVVHEAMAIPLEEIMALLTEAGLK